ncbi:hypothetical protein MASR2M48_17500 [Spirochaetota bacterium]
MKRLWPIAAALLVASCASQPEPALSSGKEPLNAADNNPVRMERIEEFKTPLVAKETISFADGMIDKVVSYTYEDEYSRLVSIVTQKPSSSRIVERIVYAYSDDRLTSKTTFGTNGLIVSTNVYLYDEDGKLIEETILDARNQTQSVSKWTWDQGRKLSWRVYSGADALQARTDYVYDGEILKTTRLFDGSGIDKGRIEYVYRHDGALMRLDYFNAAGVHDGRTEYTLIDDLVGNRVGQERVYRADGRLERRLDFFYSPDGALIKKTLADSGGRVRETIVYENAYRTDTRTIIYYQ